jgi:hypothetical protein
MVRRSTHAAEYSSAGHSVVFVKRRYGNLRKGDNLGAAPPAAQPAVYRQR